MKALWKNKLYAVIENYHDYIELSPVDGEGTVQVDWADDSLIIDPTDGDIEEAEMQLELET